MKLQMSLEEKYLLMIVIVKIAVLGMQFCGVVSVHRHEDGFRYSVCAYARNDNNETEQLAR
jgi:hypothetical protein